MASSLRHPYMAVPDDWAVHQLKELTTKIGSGATPRGGKNAYIDEGVHLIRSQNVHDLDFRRAGLAHITHEAAKKLTGVEVQSGDVLLNITGASIARCCKAPDWVLPARVNQHVAILRPTSRLDSDFLMYLLVHPAMRGYILSHNAGASREAVTKRHIEELLVPRPPLVVQHAIAEVLGSLDDGILEAERSVEAHHRLLRLAYSALPISDYPIVQIGEAVEVVGGSTPRTSVDEYWGDEHAWVTPRDLAATGQPVVLTSERRITDSGISEISSGLLPLGTVLLSSRAPIGYLAVAGVPLAVNQGFIALKPSLEVSPGYLLCWLEANLEEVKSRAGGSTFAEISKRNFRPIPLATPNGPEYEWFKSVAEVALAAMTEAQREAETLARLRDALLPELLSGRLRVDHPERLLEGVA